MGSTAIAQFLNTKEAADLLGCSEYTLRAMRTRTKYKRRSGPPYHRVPGGIRYHVEELRAYIEACKVTPKRALPVKPPAE